MRLCIESPRVGESIRRRACWIIAFGLAGIVGAWVAPAAAHDIPADVAIQVFARPETQRLTVLLRVPLAAMRDVTFPTRDGTVLIDLSNPARLDAVLRDAALLWVIPSLGFYEDGRRLDPPRLTAVRVSLPSDRSFGDYAAAHAHLRAPPLPAETVMPWNQALFDLGLEYDIHSDRARFAIEPTFARFGLRVATSLRFVVPGHPERAFHFSGDPGSMALDPRWHQAAARFVALGFEHILDGLDHLLFLFCLVILRRDVRSLVVVVTAFTVAHSITLLSAAFGYAPGALWFPPLIETLIAASIVYMALENIVLVVAPIAPVPGFVGPRPVSGLRGRGVIAFGFGLVHGFGFSFALQDTLQFAGSHMVTALFAFNIGVELGQLLVIALLVPLLSLLFRFVVPEKIGIVLASALAAHTAWHWMIDRGATLGQYDWSLSDPAGLATVTRWLMVGVAIAGVIWWMRQRRAE
jgi:hypothetical protein